MAFMLLPRHRASIENEIYPSRMAETMRQLILTYASQELKRKSDIDGGEATYSCTNVNVKAMEVTKVQKHLNIWQVWEG